MKVAPLVEKIKQANDFDEVIALVQKFDGEVSEYSNILEFLTKVQGMPEKECVDGLNGLCEFVKTYQAPDGENFVGDMTMEDLVARLEGLVKLSGEELKTGLSTLLTELTPKADTKPAKTPEEIVAEAAEAKKIADAVKLAEEQKLKATVNIFAQEIASVGDYGDKGKVTEDDLNQMTENFILLKEQVKPCLKLGHTDKAPLKDLGVDEGTGMPAVGWISKIWVAGTKLLADFTDIPAKIAEAIRTKAYLRKSPEIYTDYKDEATGKTYGKVLRAVALLGADVPAMKSLNDLEVLYHGEDFSKVDILFGHDDQSKGGDDDMKFEELDKRTSKLEEIHVADSVNRFVEGLEKEGKITPAAREIVTTVLIATAKNEKDKISFSETDDKGVETKSDLTLHNSIRKMLASLPVYVDFAEKGKGDVDGVAPDAAELAAVEKIAKDDKIPFSEAWDKYHETQRTIKK